MAFEAYRGQGKGSSLAKRVVFVLVAAGHGAAIAAGVVYSYWHVDELTPPTLRVTFISAAPPPPPPPPPPAGGGARPKKVAMKTVTPVVVPKPTEIVQPREKLAPVKKEFRKHVDEEEDEDEDGPKNVGGKKGGIAGGEAGGELGGTPGGKLGGTIGGTPGGVGSAPVAAKFLPPGIANGNKLSGGDPPFPVTLRRGTTEYVVRVKICVSRTGSIESVTLMKKADPLLDDAVVNTVKNTWRYRPYMSNNVAVPWCTFSEFLFKSQQ